MQTDMLNGKTQCSQKKIINTRMLNMWHNNKIFYQSSVKSKKKEFTIWVVYFTWLDKFLEYLPHLFHKLSIKEWEVCEYNIKIVVDNKS